MAIAPGTQIKILKNIPLDNTYRNTITFANPSDQSNYFIAKKKYDSIANSYQRLEKETIRVNIHADYLYDCNYLMYSNAAILGKWIYCFITGIQYINEQVTELTIEIDVMQTWYFNYNVNHSFVEREHVNDDTIGAHLVPENLELGDYISDQPKRMLADIIDPNNIDAESSYTVVAATFNKQLTATAGNNYGGIYSGLYLNVFENYNDVSTFIDNAVSANKGDGIVCVYTVMKEFVDPRLITSDPEGISGHLVSKQFTISKKYDNLDGYVPKNNKLFTYPYNFLYVTNNGGNSADFKYEYFIRDNANNCTFTVSGNMIPNPQIMLTPIEYKILGGTFNYNEKMIIEGFPQCSFNTDTYKAWVAQNGTSSAINFGGSIAQTLLSAGSGQVGGTVSGIETIAQDLNRVNVMSAMPPHAHGSTGDSITYTLGTKDFTFYPMHIRSEFAEIIDNYFSSYGYKVNAIKSPNTTGRKNWNYVKTINVSITGSIPANDMAKIRSIYDSGVTFWHNGDNVGNYTLDNSIV